jgi:dolichol-phosphate mannosyltransferase
MLASSGPDYGPAMRCVIVVPTYNEAASLPELLNAMRTLRATAEHATIDVLVVDDSSPDGTGALVRAHSGFGEWLALLTRTSKDGLGAAYRTGFSAAMADGYDAVVQMDADGSHPLTAVPAMLALLRTHDVVLGSRYVHGGSTVNWPRRRQALSWCANAYARRVLGLSTRDTTTGFRAWRSEAVVAAGVLHTGSNGYGFQVENTWRCERLGLRVAEHPITFTERSAGVSKMSPEVAREAAALVLRWRIEEITHRTGAPVRIPRAHSTGGRQ